MTYAVLAALRDSSGNTGRSGATAAVLGELPTASGRGSADRPSRIGPLAVGAALQDLELAGAVGQSGDGGGQLELTGLGATIAWLVGGPSDVLPLLHPVLAKLLLHGKCSRCCSRGSGGCAD